MTHSILIADPDVAFGQMLEQMLTLNGDYTASAVTSGAFALAAVQAAPPDLAIVDLSLADVSPLTLISAMRRVAPGLRVMLIPIGTTLPGEYASLDVQGVLTKPFFIGDLGESIARALGTVTKHLIDLPPAPVRSGTDIVSKPRVRQVVKSTAPEPVEPAEPAPVTPPVAPAASPPRQPTVRRERFAPPPTASVEPKHPSVAPPRVRQAAPAPARRTVIAPPAFESPAAPSTGTLEQALAALASEVRAELLLLLRDGLLIAQQGTPPADRVGNLLDLLKQWSLVAGSLASLVGEPRGRFKQLHLEGERYHIYGFEISAGAVLVVVCRADIPFGTLRLAIKSAGPAIARHLPQ